MFYYILLMWKSILPNYELILLNSKYYNDDIIKLYLFATVL